MSRLLRGVAVAALSVAALGVSAAAASAQSYGRLVVFGDSLSDNGNLFIATGGTQPPSPPYFQGRFSTGPVFTELLGFTAANFNGPVTGSINLAFGGARTDLSATPLGMRAQLATYTGRGGTFGANTLVSVLGGANNIFQGLPAAGASANPSGAITPVALSAAADVNLIVGSVAQAGAGTILVTNLPKLSLTPQFRNTPAAPLADFAVTTFNSALATGLTNTANARPGTNIILMDLFKVGDVISADPGRFGISNVTAACFNGATVCANPSSYFYFDGVHPTATGHQLIATLANDYLYYGDRGAQATVLGETSFRHREDTLDEATEALGGHAAWEAGTTFGVTGTVDRVETDARGVVGASDSDGYGVRVAVEAGPSETWRFGLAGGYKNADVDAGAVRFELDTFSFDAYAGWRSGATFVTVAGGVADDKYDYRRTTALAAIVHSATAEGNSWGARAQAGFWFGGEGGLAFSPRAAVTWTNARVDSFVEQGPAAAYAYQRREFDAVSAEATLRAEGDLGGLAFYAEGGYRDTLSEGGDPVRVGIWGNPAQTLSRSVEEPFGGQILANVGLEGDVGRFKVSLGYRGRIGDHADSHAGALTIRLPL